jgi:hypothetical protein
MSSQTKLSSQSYEQYIESDVRNFFCKEVIFGSKTRPILSKFSKKSSMWCHFGVKHFAKNHGILALMKSPCWSND